MSQAQPNQAAGELLGSNEPDADATRAALGTAGMDHGPPTEKPAAPAFDLPAAVRTHESRLLRYVGTIVGNHADGRGAEAQDVVQEVFLRLHQQVSRHGESSVEHLPAWLGKTAHNLAIDAVRRRKLDQQGIKRALDDAAGSPEKTEESPSAAMENRESVSRAVAELANLPADLRGLLLLKIDHGLTMRQIAEVTGMTPGNVGYRITQALAELASRLKKQGVF